MDNRDNLPDRCSQRQAESDEPLTFQINQGNPLGGLFPRDSVFLFEILNDLREFVFGGCRDEDEQGMVEVRNVGIILTDVMVTR